MCPSFRAVYPERRNTPSYSAAPANFNRVNLVIKCITLLFLEACDSYLSVAALMLYNKYGAVLYHARDIIINSINYKNSILFYYIFFLFISSVIFGRYLRYCLLVFLDVTQQYAFPFDERNMGCFLPMLS